MLLSASVEGCFVSRMRDFFVVNANIYSSPQPIQQRDTTWTKLFVGGLPYHTTDKSLRYWTLQSKHFYMFALGNKYNVSVSSTKSIKTIVSLSCIKMNSGWRKSDKNWPTSQLLDWLTDLNKYIFFCTHWWNITLSVGGYKLQRGKAHKWKYWPMSDKYRPEIVCLLLGLLKVSVRHFVK